MGFFFIMGFLCIAGPFIISRYFWKDIPSSDSKNEEQIELEDINQENMFESHQTSQARNQTFIRSKRMSSNRLLKKEIANYTITNDFEKDKISQ